MLKFFLVAHLTYENQWVKLHNKKNIFGFFGTPYSTDPYPMKMRKPFARYTLSLSPETLFFVSLVIIAAAPP